MRQWLRIISLALVLCLVFWAVPALGDTVFTIDLDALDMNRVGDDAYVQQYLSGGAQTIRVSKFIGEDDGAAASVRLTVLRADTKQTMYDKDYGLISGVFESGDIYLPYPDSGSMFYLITLYLGQWVYAVPFLQVMPRLYNNGACTGGFRFSEASGGLSGDWLMGTMIDLDGLAQGGGVMQTPICASNQYLLGCATVKLSGGCLTVDIDLDANANAELVRYRLYIITDVSGVTTLNPNAMAQPSVQLGQPVEVSGAAYALIYLPMTVNYDSALLSTFQYDAYSVGTQYQLSLWETARAWTDAPEEPAEPSLPDDQAADDPDAPTDGQPSDDPDAPTDSSADSPADP